MGMVRQGKMSDIWHVTVHDRAYEPCVLTNKDPRTIVEIWRWLVALRADG
jgi:hypothetical protein